MKKLRPLLIALAVLLVVGTGVAVLASWGGEKQAGGDTACTSAIGVECVCTSGCSAGLVDCDCTGE